MADMTQDMLDVCGLFEPGECLRCDVCCRFPEATTNLAPFFSRAETADALKHGLPIEVFLPAEFGTGQAISLLREGEIFRCPAFQMCSHECRIYDRRPLDCRLYPFMLMCDREGARVMLGVDSYCPAAERASAELLERCADELAKRLDGDMLPAVLAGGGMIGEFKEHLRPMRELPNLGRRLCRTDLNLRRFTIAARESLLPYFESNQGSLSYHAFAPIHVWSDLFDIRYGLSNGQLLLFAEADGDAFLIAPPMGSGSKVKASAEALEILRALNPNGVSPRIQEVAERDVAELLSGGWRVRESQPEYVYRREELAELRGNRFEKKRQSCNRFERENVWNWRPYESDDMPGVSDLCRRWLASRTGGHDDEFYSAQAEAILRAAHRAMRDADMLDLRTRVLETNGELAGFTAGCSLHDGKSFFIMFEFCDLTRHGGAQFMFRQLCRELTDYEFINAGGASGLEGLRRVKESYRPSLRLPALTMMPV